LKNLKSIISFILLFGTLTACAQLNFGPKYNDEEASLETIVNEIISEYITEPGNIGLVVGLLDDTSKVSIGYGKMAADEELRPDGNSFFEIGSITKPLTALTAIEMEKAGIINFSDAISKYLPDSLNNEFLANISINNLISHQAGFPRKPYNLSLTITDEEDPYANYTESDLLNYLSVFKPIKSRKKKRALFKYSNLGYGILSLVLANAANQSYEKLVQQYVLKPLSLNSTKIKLSQRDSLRMVTPHNFKGEPTPIYSYQSMEGSSALKSTANDLLSFMDLNIKENATVNLKQSHQKQVETNLKRIYMAYGWHIIDRGKRFPPVITHNGGTGGCRSYVAFIKETKTGVVVLSNSANRVDEIGIELLELLNQGKY